MEPLYAWDEEVGTASCVIFYKDKQFVGIACCHPEDDDMRSALTGQTIAEMRATIDYLKYVRDVEIKPQLASLKQLYFSMKHSKRFNPKSYEAKTLIRHIKSYEDDLANIKKMIEQERTDLRQYINQKDAMYRLLRSKRYVEGQEALNAKEEN